MLRLAPPPASLQSPMDISSLLQQHIYTALIIGSMVEGETTVILAGYAAHQGYAAFWVVAALAAGASFLLDLAWYGLGRWQGPALQARWPALRRGSDILGERVNRRPRLIVFSVRFMYGLRTAGPITLGMVRVPIADVLIFGALSAAVWGTLFAGLGYAFGRAVMHFLHELAHYELLMAGVLAVAGLLFLLYRRARRRRLLVATDAA